MYDLDKNNGVPLYLQIKEIIKQEIQIEKYKIGTYLPSEVKLMEFFGVSRTTIRLAIESLIREGFLEIHRGVGTLIKKPENILWDLQELKSFEEEAKSKGLNVNTKILIFEMLEIHDANILSEFENKYNNFFHIQRLRLIDGSPVEITDTYVPVSLAPNLNLNQLENNSLFEVLSDNYDLNFSYSEKVFRAIIIPSDIATYLNEPKGNAIQFVKSTTYDKNDFPFEHSLTYNGGLLSSFKVRLYSDH